MSFRKLAIRKLAGALGLLLALSLVLVPAAPVLAVPQNAHVFYGTVTTEGGAADVGTVITASVAGMEFITTVDSEGKYGYSPAPAFKILADDPDTSEVEGAEVGDPIEFYIGVDGTKAELYDVEAEEPLDSYPFEIGGLTNLNLIIGEAPPPTLTAEAGGPYSGIVGASIALSGSATGGTPDYTYAWDLDYDGTYETTGATVSHSWATADTYTVGLRVTDVSATATDTATVTVTEEAFDPLDYDFDDSGTISKPEALAAVNDYLADPKIITRGQCLAVVKRYFG